VKAQASGQREVWLQIWMTAYRNTYGQIQGIRGLVKDISQRKRISEENLRLKEHFHRIIELSPLPTLIIEHGSISLANRAALGLWGLAQMSDILGRSVEGLLSETDQLTLHALHRRAIAQGVADHAAMQIHRADGLIRDVEASASLIPGQASDALQLVLYDTTEAKTTLRLLQESQQESQRLSANLLSAREEERRYIARELHDELGQRLSVLKIRINDILKQSVAANGHYAQPFQDRLEELLDDADDMVRALRRMASHLRPAMLDDLGLQAAIEWLAQDSAQCLNIHVQTRLALGVDELMDPVRITVYRLIQEALTNVGKHAQAKQVEITIDWDADTLIASIQDDGVGPQDHSVQAERPKWGLIGLRERAAQLGGTLKVDANPSGGYRLLMQIPQAKPPIMNEPAMLLEIVS
jgi:two-component system sensor histidine kinase UhpB